eukprot:jgi/Psemu1/292792/fgenesh1_pg.1324_\
MCIQPQPQQWIVFTAGVYGAGKSYTIRRLQSERCFPPSDDFVWVDPDAIRERLPEFANNANGNTNANYPPAVSGIHTQKEAGMMAELLSDAALSSGHNVLVDGSLRDADWQSAYWALLRKRFGGDNTTNTTTSNKGRGLSIGMVSVVAPPEKVLTARILARERATGRGIPMAELEESLRTVPAAVERLVPEADFVNGG